jgi:soluble cytochrome b562
LASQKREKVLEQKKMMGDLRHGLMSLVANQDNVWDLIGQEENFKDNSQI